MKTKITKTNAVIIIENALKQETLLQSLEKLMNGGGDDFNGSISVLDAIFNYDPSQINQEDYDVIWNIFFGKIKLDSKDFKSVAEQIYDETLEFMTKLDQRHKESYWIPKLYIDDALKLIGTNIMGYALWMKLSDIGMSVDNYSVSYSDILYVLFDNVPDTIERDEMMEIFYLKTEEFVKSHDFKTKVPEKKLCDLSYEIYRGMQKEIERRREVRVRAA
ncbi:hypothetical protein [Flagellimonas marina]|uniref:Uncharacterized protein n=1 Tax=Flagellimonas marina TaxID=1775168 RepID=A0ABV8PHK2_9FLAO